MSRDDLERPWRGFDLLERQAFDAVAAAQRRGGNLFGLGIGGGLCIGAASMLAAGWLGVAVGAAVSMIVYAWVTR